MDDVVEKILNLHVRLMGDEVASLVSPAQLHRYLKVKGWEPVPMRENGPQGIQWLTKDSFRFAIPYMASDGSRVEPRAVSEAVRLIGCMEDRSVLAILRDVISLTKVEE